MSQQNGLSQWARRRRKTKTGPAEPENAWRKKINKYTGAATIIESELVFMVLANNNNALLLGAKYLAQSRYTAFLDRRKRNYCIITRPRVNAVFVYGFTYAYNIGYVVSVLGRAQKSTKVYEPAFVIS